MGHEEAFILKPEHKGQNTTRSDSFKWRQLYDDIQCSVISQKSSHKEEFDLHLSHEGYEEKLLTQPFVETH